jgi:hypothetical protein
MKTFPSIREPDGCLRAFEIENAYIGPSDVAGLLRRIDGVTDVARRPPFSRESEVHVRFNYKGHPCMVWEPYGDNSRYWIGPESDAVFDEDMAQVEIAFAAYRPPLHRAVVGRLLTLHFLKG